MFCGFSVCRFFALGWLRPADKHQDPSAAWSPSLSKPLTAPLTRTERFWPLAARHPHRACQSRAEVRASHRQRVCSGVRAPLRAVLDHGTQSCHVKQPAPAASWILAGVGAARSDHLASALPSVAFHGPGLSHAFGRPTPSSETKNDKKRAPRRRTALARAAARSRAEVGQTVQTCRLSASPERPSDPRACRRLGRNS